MSWQEWLRGVWPEPPRPRRWVIAAALGVGLLAATLLPGVPRVGVNLLICGLAAAVPVGLLARQSGLRSGRRRPIGPVAVVLGALAVALPAVAAVRASEWLAWGCALAALCLGAAVALDVRGWRSVFATVALFGLATLRSLPWAGSAARMPNARTRALPWLNGLGLGLLFMLVVAGLLASADADFADLLSVFRTPFHPDLLPARALLFVLAAATALGGCFAVSTRLAWLRPAVQTARSRHPAEWLTPLVLVAMTIAAFLAVEANRLFGGAEVVLRQATVTHADRAREGFGQLTVVTLLVLGLLSWSGSIAAAGPARHRRLMAVAGGGLLALTLLLTGSALRRLWLYQDAYGWTVTRIDAGAFELWVALVLLGVAAGWAVRRTDLLPRFVIGSAGFGLLVVALVGPDALAAEGNVHRFESSGRIDVGYLSSLSADAVPALNRLPEPQRSCALVGHHVTDDRWFGWNLSRSRANRLLQARPPGACPTPSVR
jgi:hypothetical protein